MRLPRGGKPLDRYSNTGDYREAVGPGHLQAIAMADAPTDLPLYLRQLWRTDDEKTFRRVPLPWKQLAFGGMAFASDGSLLLAERKVPFLVHRRHLPPGPDLAATPPGTPQ